MSRSEILLKNCCQNYFIKVFSKECFISKRAVKIASQKVVAKILLIKFGKKIFRNYSQKVLSKCSKTKMFLKT